MDAIVRGDDGGGRQKAMRVDYPANSQKAKKTPDQEKVVEAVVTTPATKRKKNLLDRFAHSIFAEDADGVVSYVVVDVLLPAFKSLLYDTVSQGFERALYGENRRGSSSRPGGYVNYSRVSSERTQRPALSRQARATHDFNDIMLQSRVEAENVIDGLRTLIDQYQQASVSDLYDLVGLTADFADATWGWIGNDLRDADVRAVRGGYLLNLPRTRALA
jgi:hypothetical protein